MEYVVTHNIPIKHIQIGFALISTHIPLNWSTLISIITKKAKVGDQRYPIVINQKSEGF